MRSYYRSDEIDEAILLIVERMWEKLQKGTQYLSETRIEVP